jgi:hypothetical protein
MADRKPFLLRLDRTTLDALQRWANDEVRSLNGQLEYLLTKALREAGRLTQKAEGGSREASGREKR